MPTRCYNVSSDSLGNPNVANYGHIKTYKGIPVLSRIPLYYCFVGLLWGELARRASNTREKLCGNDRARMLAGIQDGTFPAFHVLQSYRDSL